MPRIVSSAVQRRVASLRARRAGGSGGPPDRPESQQDPQRDSTTLPLIRAAVAAGVPIFCICRGIQVLNVALRGSLYRARAEAPGEPRHPAPPAASQRLNHEGGFTP